MTRIAHIIEKDRELACGDEYCCGYYYVQGQIDTVEVDEDTEKRLKDAVDELYNYETVDPTDFGITTHLNNIGWVSFWDEDE